MGDESSDGSADLEDTGDEASFLRKVAGAGAPGGPPALGPDLSGRQLGQLVLRRKLGEGGMGVVYLAEDRRLHRSVAVKILPASLAADEERTRRFLREARAASAVLHPSIAAVFGAGEADGIVFLVMELVDGRTLRALLREREGPLALDEASRLTRAVAGGLAAAHEAGVIHRDLKPENVMVSGEGRVKILDFGLAKRAPAGVPEGPAAVNTATELMTVEGRIMGTPGYMSPEQAKGRAVDARTDVFSLGVMLYEMVTGARPFRGSTPIEVLIATDRDTPPPASSLRPEAPPALDAIIARCLEKRPEDRFASCRELGAALDAAVLDSGARSRPFERPLEGGRPAEPERPARAASPRAGLRFGAAAVLGAAAVVASLARPGRGPQHAAGAPSRTLAAKAEVLACPPLALAEAARGHGAWLGAAAASMACDRAMHVLGGRPERVLLPAALLDLPRTPTSAFPLDPYGDEGARGRALAAARARGSFVLDGEVEGDGDGFRVALALREPGGSVAASREGRGQDVLEAAHKAVDGLAEAGALPLAASVDPAAADWLGTADTRELLAWHAFYEAEQREIVSRSTALCADPPGLEPRFGSLAPLARIECKSYREPAFLDVQVPPLPVDARTPGALALTARYHVVSGGPTGARELAAKLHEAWTRETDPLGRALLAQAEAEMWQTGGDAGKAREMALCAVDAAPALPRVWRGLASSTNGADGFDATARAYAGWRPDEPFAWRLRAQLARDPAAKPGADLSPLELARRAYTLSPEAGAMALDLGELLLLSGDREQTRAIAARLLASPASQRERATSGEALMLAMETAQARFGAAYERALRVLADRESFSGVAVRRLGQRAMLTAAALDRRPELADLMIRRFIAVDPPRLEASGRPAMMALWACAHASPALRLPCIKRVQELARRSYFVALSPGFKAALAGAERFAGGDSKGAAAAWRPILKEASAGPLRDTMAVAFDEAGEREIAERVDEDLMKQDGLWGGATLSHARAARRAAARGDGARARALAEQVVASWLLADTPVPAVADMRALLKKL